MIFCVFLETIECALSYTMQNKYRIEIETLTLNKNQVSEKQLQNDVVLI